MIAWWWSWLLTAIGVGGLFLAGSKRKLGWAVGLGAQAFWVAYAVATDQYGFIFSAAAYGSVYARNWVAWWREDKSPRRFFFKDYGISDEDALRISDRLHELVLEIAESTLNETFELTLTAWNKEKNRSDLLHRSIAGTTGTKI